MQRAVHAMRLRTRNAAAAAANAEASSSSVAEGTQTNKRSVLGDVSNKRRAPSDGTKNEQKAKKSRKSADALAVSNVNDENVTANLRNRDSGRRRSSARLRKKTVEKSKSCSTSSRSSGRASARKTVIAIDSDSDNDGDDSTREDSKEQQPLVVPSDDIVLPRDDYMLQRRTFDGTNHTLGYAPHDVKDKDDVLQVANYVTDMFQHLYKAESESAPTPYMDEQRDINAKMRAILVDWLVEVHMKFRLVPETLYLCVNLIDRYCNKVPVARAKLQLVGVTALLIACKYEEIYPPEVRDCVYITDRAYGRQEVLDMEQDILDCLEFKITVPTAYPFLFRYLNITNASPLTRFAAQYYMERTLQEHDLLAFRPSLVCAAAVSLALNNADIQRQEAEEGEDDEDDDDDREYELPGMPRSLLEYTNFDQTEILKCAKIIAKKVAEEPVTASRRQLIAVKRKYDNRKYLHVSTAVEQPDYLDIVANTPGGDDVGSY